MKLFFLPIFVALFGVVSLTSARFLPYYVHPMARMHSMRSAAASRPMSAIEGESIYGGAEEEGFSHGLGGSELNNLRSQSRSFKPQYGPFLEAAELGYQGENDANPWAAY